MKAKAEVIYLGDNGRAYCGEHLGATGQAGLRDISGQPLLAITPDVIRAEPTAADFECEHPRCGRRPSRLHLRGV